MESEENSKPCNGNRIPRVRLGTPEMRGTGITELRLIAGVNEAIKVAIEASGKIGLLAINANLLAGRAGERAVGFCVVASELRRFSESMAAAMQNWSQLIYELVRETARSRNQARILARLRDAGCRSDKAQASICTAHERCLQELDELTQANSLRVIALQGMIQRAEKQRITGEVISRSAMIESAYGGAMRQMLLQIAREIDMSIARFAEFSSNVGFMMKKATA